jgi:hypothetical protein
MRHAHPSEGKAGGEITNDDAARGSVNHLQRFSVPLASRQTHRYLQTTSKGGHCGGSFMEDGKKTPPGILPFREAGAGGAGPPIHLFGTPVPIFWGSFWLAFHLLLLGGFD